MDQSEQAEVSTFMRSEVETFILPVSHRDFSVAKPATFYHKLNVLYI